MKSLGLTSEATYSVADPALGAALAKMWGNHPGAMGVSAASALQITACWSCVRILSETIGALPRAVYRDEGNGNVVRADDHEVAAVLIRSPNADMTGQEMTEAQVANLALRGNSYSETTRNVVGGLTSIYPLPGSTVPCRKPNGDIVYEFWDRGQKETLPAEKVWHVKGFGANGLVGLSPIAAVRQAFGNAMTLDKFGQNFFENGARLSGFFKIPQWLKDDQREAAKKVLALKYGGTENAGKIGLLEGGMEYQQLSVPPEDAQFLQTKQASKQDIFSIFRIPPHLAGDLSKATFSNIEQQSQDFVQFTLLPYLVRFEQTANRRLFKPEERGKYFLRFNVEGLLRADSAARASLYSVLLQNGVYNRNEVRALENRPRSDDAGMDDYTVQTNMTVIQLLEAMNKASGAPTP